MKSIIILSFCVVLVVGLEPKPASTVLENYGTNGLIKMDNYSPSILENYKSIRSRDVREHGLIVEWDVKLALLADAALRKCVSSYKEDSCKMPMLQTLSQSIGFLKFPGGVPNDQSTRESISAIIQNWRQENLICSQVFSTAFNIKVGCAAAFMPAFPLILGLICKC